MVQRGSAWRAHDHNRKRLHPAPAAPRFVVAEIGTTVYVFVAVLFPCRLRLTVAARVCMLRLSQQLQH